MPGRISRPNWIKLPGVIVLVKLPGVIVLVQEMVLSQGKKIRGHHWGGIFGMADVFFWHGVVISRLIVLKFCKVTGDNLTEVGGSPGGHLGCHFRGP